MTTKIYLSFTLTGLAVHLLIIVKLIRCTNISINSRRISNSIYSNSYVISTLAPKIHLVTLGDGSQISEMCEHYKSCNQLTSTATFENPISFPPSRQLYHRKRHSKNMILRNATQTSQGGINLLNMSEIWSGLTNASSINTQNYVTYMTNTSAKIELDFVQNKTQGETAKASASASFRPINFMGKKPIKYAVPLLGYAGTGLICLTLVTNTFVVVVLLHKNMRSPTNTLLACMAITDILTGIFPLPWMTRYYVFRGYLKPVSLPWCKYYAYGVMHIPTIFHTASIWLITALAAQRYLYVCYSNLARSWCTVPRVLITVVFIYVAAAAPNIARFFEYNYAELNLNWTTMLQNWGETQSLRLINSTRAYKMPSDGMVNHCGALAAPWLEKWENVYFNLYYWFRVVFVHVVPCTSLVVLNGLLIYAMRKAVDRRKKLMKDKRGGDEKKVRDTNSTTYMLVLVVTVFLIVEIPLGIIFVLHIIENTFEVSVLNYQIAAVLSTVIDFLILASYPVNFFIYCRMSKQFRDTFNQLLSSSPCCGRRVRFFSSIANGSPEHIPLTNHHKADGYKLSKASEFLRFKRRFKNDSKNLTSFILETASCPAHRSSAQNNCQRSRLFSDVPSSVDADYQTKPHTCPSPVWIKAQITDEVSHQNN